MNRQQAEKTMASYRVNVEKTTGKKFDYWVNLVKKSKLEKHGELVNMLKTEYGMGHGYANLIVHEAKGGLSMDKNTNTVIDGQYKGKENLKPWYDAIIREVEKMGKDLEINPKKAYVSLVRKRQFALIQPSAKERMDIGLHLKGVPASGIAEASGSWHAMCTHRIKLEDGKKINKELINWIKQAYEQAG